MALKSLVNDAAEMFGVAPPEALLLAEPLADELLELEDELPHAATSAVIASAGSSARSQRGIKGTLLSVKTPYGCLRVSGSN
jgi:hypothetical protein